MSSRKQHCAHKRHLFCFHEHLRKKSILLSDKFITFTMNHLRRFFITTVRSFSASTTEKPAVNSYGDNRMPDKLYKTIELEMKSAEPAVLKSYQTFITTAANHLGIEIGKSWSVKPNKKRWTLLKSVHIYRKHLVQYEVRTYYRWIQLHKMTGSTADTFLEYIERMLPEGVGLKVTKLSIEPLPDHITPEEMMKAHAEFEAKHEKESETR